MKSSGREHWKSGARQNHWRISRANVQTRPDRRVFFTNATPQPISNDERGARPERKRTPLYAFRASDALARGQAQRMRSNRAVRTNDADTRARWWMRAKDEWIAAQREGRAFVNPLEPKTLRWCS
jgi:hypothetical protein